MGGGGLHSTPPDSAPSIAAISGGTGKGKKGGGGCLPFFLGGGPWPRLTAAAGLAGGPGGPGGVAVGSDGWAGAGAGSGEAASGRAFPHGRPRLPPAAGWRSSMVGGLRPPATDPKFVFPTPPWGTDIPPPPRGGMAKGCGRRGGGGAIVGLGSAAGRAWVGGSFGVCVSPTPVCLGGGWSVLSCDVSGFVGALGGTGPSWASRWGWGFVAGGCHWGAGGVFCLPPGLVPNVDILRGDAAPPAPPEHPIKCLQLEGVTGQNGGGASAPPQHPNSTRRWQLGGALV